MERLGTGLQQTRIYSPQGSDSDDDAIFEEAFREVEEKYASNEKLLIPTAEEVVQGDQSEESLWEGIARLSLKNLIEEPYNIRLMQDPFAEKLLIPFESLLPTLVKHQSYPKEETRQRSWILISKEKQSELDAIVEKVVSQHVQFNPLEFMQLIASSPSLEEEQKFMEKVALCSSIEDAYPDLMREIEALQKKGVCTILSKEQAQKTAEDLTPVRTHVAKVTDNEKLLQRWEFPSSHALYPTLVEHIMLTLEIDFAIAAVSNSKESWEGACIEATKKTFKNQKISFELQGLLNPAPNAYLIDKWYELFKQSMGGDFSSFLEKMHSQLVKQYHNRKIEVLPQ